jgi:hypothetical protein
VGSVVGPCSARYNVLRLARGVADLASRYNQVMPRSTFPKVWDRPEPCIVLDDVDAAAGHLLALLEGSEVS